MSSSVQFSVLLYIFKPYFLLILFVRIKKMYEFLCNRRTTKHSSGFHFEYRTGSRRRYSDEHTSSTINRRWNNSKYVYVTCHCKYSSKLDIFTISCQSNKECILFTMMLQTISHKHEIIVPLKNCYNMRAQIIYIVYYIYTFNKIYVRDGN